MTTGPTSILIRGRSPASTHVARVEVGLPGARTIGLTGDPGILVVGEIGPGLVRTHPVSMYPLDGFCGVVEDMLTESHRQLWVRDRTLLVERFGAVAIALETSLASLARRHGVGFVGWTGDAYESEVATDAYEEVRDTQACSALLGTHRTRE